LIVNGVRGLRTQAFIDAENELKYMLEPHTRRRTSKKKIMLGKGPPDLSRVPFHLTSVGERNAQAFQRNSLTVEHPEDVVIRDEEKIGRIEKSNVFGIPARVGMAMGTNDGQFSHMGVETSGHCTDFWVAREQTIFVHQGPLAHFFPLTLKVLRS
jgi:hypothetical protein